jgi:hypothetical protein
MLCYWDMLGLGLWLWSLAPLSTVFQLYRGGQFKSEQINWLWLVTIHMSKWGSHGRYRMVDKFTTTCAISAYHQ